MILNDAGVFAQATKNMSMVDKTSGAILIDRTTRLSLTDEQPVTDFRGRVNLNAGEEAAGVRHHPGEQVKVRAVEAVGHAVVLAGLKARIGD